MGFRSLTGLSLLAGGLLGASMAASQAASPDPDLIKRGEYLVTAGDCVACHTAPGGQKFAGGLIMQTPLGNIATPNITPDRETGIGTWTDDQFYHAVHDGVAADGSYLYPVFPFPWYTKVTRDDVLAIKAYLFAQAPVHAPRKPELFEFPFNIRDAVEVWRAAFFKPGEFTPNPAQSAKINRGAYLVQGLGHCAECHSGISLLGASSYSEPLQGGSIQGWYAPNITSDVRQGIGSWSEDEIATYLKTGAVPGKGIVLGPMAETIEDSLSHLTDDDLHAIAAYLKSTPAESHETPQAEAASAAPGAVRDAAYLNYCASCHQVNGRGVPGVVPALAGNGAVNAGGAENVIRVVLGGLQARGTYGPMPGFGADMSDQAIAEAVNYVRTAWGNTAPANASPGQVAKLAAETNVALSGHGPECPAPEVPGGTTKAIDTAASAITPLMQKITDANMLEQVDAITQKAKAAAPDAKPADLVNGLSAVYCPIVAQAQDITLAQRRWRLQRFDQLVYSQVARPGQAARKD